MAVDRGLPPANLKRNSDLPRLTTVHEREEFGSDCKETDDAALPWL